MRYAVYICGISIFFAILMISCQPQTSDNPAFITSTMGNGTQDGAVMTPTSSILSPTPSATPTSTEVSLPSPTITPTPLLPEDTEITNEPTLFPETLSPTPTLEPTPISPEPNVKKDCVDQAVFLADITIPDGTFFEAGEKFTKTWRVKNTGTCTWGKGYSLVFAQGDQMSGNLEQPLPETLPGETADFSIDLMAPNRPGPQTGNWILQNSEGEKFGFGVPPTGLIWVSIIVDYLSTPLTSDMDDAPTTSFFSQNCLLQENQEFEELILALINQTRIENGLPIVVLQPQLANAARIHSQDMACNDYVDHDGSDGSTWYDRAAVQGFRNSTSTRENIYVGDPAFGGTAEGAFNWWMNSQVHRENILNSSMDVAGVGYVYLPGSTYGGYYTLVLGRGQ